MLGLGALVGWVNGVVTTRFRIQSFIVTLAMMSVARGLARIISGGLGDSHCLRPGGGPGELLLAGHPHWPDSRPRHPDAAVAVLAGLLLHYTAFGRHVYAIGGNEVAARLSGVRVDRVKIAVFVICAARSPRWPALSTRPSSIRAAPTKPWAMS